MLANQAVLVAMMTAVLLSGTTVRAGTAPLAVKLCGRQLSEMMSRICQSYNSPSWAVPTVVEQSGTGVRRRRHLGIADECCIIGCTWEQISRYCSISAYSESPFDELDGHMIADRSAEQESAVPPAVIGQFQHAAPAVTSPAVSGSARREVGRARSRGYGRVRARGRRCWCRRKRRSGRRRSSLMGNMDLAKNVMRAAPVVGTVSPLLTWGRTLNTDLPVAAGDRDRYAYVAVYT